jgi:hypothetical protein
MTDDQHIAAVEAARHALNEAIKRASDAGLQVNVGQVELQHDPAHPVPVVRISARRKT